MRVNRVVRNGVIIGLATGVFGVAFGVLASTAGLSLAKTMALSLLVFTGASQFAAVSVIAAGGNPLAAVGSALVLAARNAFYGLTMSTILRGSFATRALAAQLTIDESTALATAQDNRRDATLGFWSAGISVFVLWNLGTLLGVIGGGLIGDPETLGIDAAFPAGFIALMMPALRTAPGRAAAVAGTVICLVTLPWAPPGVPVILAAGGAVLALAHYGTAAVETTMMVADQPDGTRDLAEASES